MTDEIVKLRQAYLAIKADPKSHPEKVQHAWEMYCEEVNRLNQQATDSREQ